MRRNQNIQIDVYRICLGCFKYIPVVCTFIFAMDCLVLLMGYNIRFMALGFGTSLTSTLTLIAASYTFRFCWLHRVTILYNFTMSLCINYEYVQGFGSYRTFARISMLIIGVTIIGMIIKRKGVCK